MPAGKLGDVEWDRRMAARLREVREAAGMTRPEFAAVMSEHGVPWSKETLWKRENGAGPLRLSEAVAVARVAGISVDELVGVAPAGEASARLRLLEVRRLRDLLDARAESILDDLR